MISYRPLWDTLERKNITTYKLIKEHGIPSKTIYNLKHNKNATLLTIETLCTVLDCKMEEVVEFIKEK